MPPEATLLLATRSDDKAREIRQILAPVFRGRIIGLDEAGLPPLPEEEDIEVFDSFAANARAKARHFMERSGMPVLADDSGISVDALGGAPGVRSRRFAGSPDLSGPALDRANNERLLDELRAVPAARRGAHYTCVAVLHLPGGRRLAAVGTLQGVIAPEPRGTGGFGYDPLFVLPATGRTLGETPAEEKNRLSHRAAAFRALAANLPELAGTRS